LFRALPEKEAVSRWIRPLCCLFREESIHQYKTGTEQNAAHYIRKPMNPGNEPAKKHKCNKNENYKSDAPPEGRALDSGVQLQDGSGHDGQHKHRC